jgi:hypothetical protein
MDQKWSHCKGRLVRPPHRSNEVDYGMLTQVVYIYIYIYIYIL